MLPAVSEESWVGERLQSTRDRIPKTVAMIQAWQSLLKTEESLEKISVKSFT
jgi:hypothetical protein